MKQVFFKSLALLTFISCAQMLSAQTNARYTRESVDDPRCTTTVNKKTTTVERPTFEGEIQGHLTVPKVKTPVGKVGGGGGGRASGNFGKETYTTTTITETTTCPGGTVTVGDPVSASGSGSTGAAGGGTPIKIQPSVTVKKN